MEAESRFSGGRGGEEEYSVCVLSAFALSSSSS